MRRLALLALYAVPKLAHAAPPNQPALPPGGASSAQSQETLSVIGGETTRMGVVQIEQGGRPIAIGTVLSKDGRVLTSLSGLGAAAEPEIRYSDGTVVKAKIGHKDKGWDLALLVPQSGRWLDGLVPADADPSAAELKAFLPAKTGKLAQTGVRYKGLLDAKTKEGEPLRAMVDVDLKGGAAVPGAPVVDAGGKVVGVLVRVCRDAPPPDKEAKADKPEAKSAPACAPLTAAAPVYALRGFVMKAPASAAMPQPWLGLGGAPSDAGNVKGIRVMGLAPGSPAEKAGLKAGDAADTIVAIDGQPIETPEALAEVIGKRAIGQTVKLLVYRSGRFREVPVTLRAAP